MGYRKKKPLPIAISKHLVQVINNDYRSVILSLSMVKALDETRLHANNVNKDYNRRNVSMLLSCSVYTRISQPYQLPCKPDSACNANKVYTITSNESAYYSAYRGSCSSLGMHRDPFSWAADLCTRFGQHVINLKTMGELQLVSKSYEYGSFVSSFPLLGTRCRYGCVEITLK